MTQLGPFILAVAAFAIVGGGLGILLARWLDLRAASADDEPADDEPDDTPDGEPHEEPGDRID